MSYIAYVELDDDRLKRVETCHFIRHLIT